VLCVPSRGAVLYRAVTGRGPGRSMSGVRASGSGVAHRCMIGGRAPGSMSGVRASGLSRRRVIGAASGVSAMVRGRCRLMSGVRIDA
jgi:hypothetical protein